MIIMLNENHFTMLPVPRKKEKFKSITFTDSQYYKSNLDIK